LREVRDHPERRAYAVLAARRFAWNVMKGALDRGSKLCVAKAGGQARPPRRS
jgi:hypothetical protein